MHGMGLKIFSLLCAICDEYIILSLHPILFAKLIPVMFHALSYMYPVFLYNTVCISLVPKEELDLIHAVVNKSSCLMCGPCSLVYITAKGVNRVMTLPYMISIRECVLSVTVLCYKIIPQTLLGFRISFFIIKGSYMCYIRSFKSVNEL